MKICIIVGTRPEIIKMAPVILECIKRRLDFFILHTGQHYSYNLDILFFKDLELPEAKYNLEVGSESPENQVEKMASKIEVILEEEKPDIVLVEGDTNSVLAGALSASKLEIKIGHVEAGLGSHDERMPEEKNRIKTDHLSDFLFAPTEKSKGILIKEKIEPEKVFVTGNTIVDSVLIYSKIAKKKSDILDKLKIKEKNYLLATLHRQENVDSKKTLSSILDGLSLVCKKFKLPMILPLHPRTKKRLEEFNIKTSDIRIIEPVGFMDFLNLETNAKLILTDSGGVQEESCILNVPCVTLRISTERPETVDVGANMIAGTDKEKILKSAKTMINKSARWENPFGDGTSGKKIIEILTK